MCVMSKHFYPELISSANTFKSTSNFLFYEFRVTGFMLRSLIHLDLSFVHGDRVFYSIPMEYYSAEKNNDFMKFAGKWMELGNVILNEGSFAESHGPHLTPHTCEMKNSQREYSADTHRKPVMMALTSLKRDKCPHNLLCCQNI
ncbi:hypothetical protein STEG23_003609 [Scotinomys teguina]